MKRKKQKADYSRLIAKVFFQMLGIVLAAILIIVFIYVLVWSSNGADFIVYLLQRVFGMGYQEALATYVTVFRGNSTLIIFCGIAATFLALILLFLTRFTRYFNSINQGIDALVKNDGNEIVLPKELLSIEKKLNTVRQNLERRAYEAKLAEQRKNDLVMYLAHDIRTPLTSVIGYLSLLDEAPDMPQAQKAKYVHITLDKAIRLEKLVNEFFEITRFSFQKMEIKQQDINLSYLLAQLADEFYPILSARGNTAVLCANDDIHVLGDAEKLARVFNNILKNAAAYSDANTEIVITALESGTKVLTRFQNKGQTIPAEKLTHVFEKFHRLDDSRTSNTGGAGLGLSIAKEIVEQHGGNITAESRDGTTTFTVALPAALPQPPAL